MDPFVLGFDRLALAPYPCSMSLGAQSGSHSKSHPCRCLAVSRRAVRRVPYANIVPQVGARINLQSHCLTIEACGPSAGPLERTGLHGTRLARPPRAHQEQYPRNDRERQDRDRIATALAGMNFLRMAQYSPSIARKRPTLSAPPHLSQRQATPSPTTLRHINRGSRFSIGG